jgi:transposase-like protein
MSISGIYSYLINYLKVYKQRLHKVTNEVMNMATRLTTTREQRGQQIAKHNNQIQRIDKTFYTVKSQSHEGEYAVTKVDGEWLCECPDNKYRQVKCKHIYAVIFSQSIRKAVQVRRIEPIQGVNECIYCGSPNIRKDGIRKNKSGHLQVFNCKDCHRDFTFNIGFEKMKHNPQAVTTAMQLYFSGESLRNTMESLKLLGVEVSHQTVYNWINKYVKLMKEYAEKLVPKVGDTWRADEIYMKVKGNMKYLFAMIDDQTRFWIAQEVAESKHKHDARKLFIQARRLMKKQPKEFIMDGLPTYSATAKRVFPNAQHTRHIRLQGDMNNNKMERMNGEIRDREKTMRGLKDTDTVILQGYQLYHNFIREHQGLDGQTPAEACGIEVKGKNKWYTLIQNASKKKGRNS